MKTLLQLYLIPDYGRRDDHLKEMVIKLSQILITTREISFLIKFGLAYTLQTSLIFSIRKSKVKVKKKILFPNEEAMRRYLVFSFEVYNFKQTQRIYKDFSECANTPESLFD